MANSQVIGYIGIACAVFFFGSNLIPIKKYETGDGMMFQYALCNGIWITGVVVSLIRNISTFNFLAMLGGVIWTTGNLCTVPIVKCIGLSRGILVWGITSMITGWATSMFGLFGMPNESASIKYKWMNYLGVVLCVICIIISSFIRNDNEEKNNLKPQLKSIAVPLENITISDKLPVIPANVSCNRTIPLLSQNNITVMSNDWTSGLNKKQRIVVGYGLSVFAGILYGINFIPCNLAVKLYFPGTPKMDMEFSQFCGILSASFVYFMIYCFYKKNVPSINIRSIMPGFFSGIMWGIAQTGFFFANAYVGEIVSFPIINCGPMIVSSIWGMTLYKEITGKKNIYLFCIVVVVMISGSCLVAFSKQ